MWNKCLFLIFLWVGNYVWANVSYAYEILDAMDSPMIAQAASSEEDSLPQAELKVGTSETVETESDDNLHLEKWYFKIALNMTASTGLGQDVEDLLGRMHGMFSGKPLEMKLLHLNTKFSMQTKDKVERLETTAVPFPAFGFSTVSGRHQFEFEIGALVAALNTVNIQTQLTLHEPACTDENPTECPMADMGFVDADTGDGIYKANIVLNEDALVFSPGIYYDYIFSSNRQRRLSLGASAGLLVASLRAKLTFKMFRTDVDDTVYGARVMEASALLSSINNIGGITRVYLGYQKDFFGILTEFRFGVAYGAVPLLMNIDGAGAVHIANILSVAFPLEKMSVNGENFNNQESKTLELTGGFFHAGILF